MACNGLLVLDALLGLLGPTLHLTDDSDPVVGREFFFASCSRLERYPTIHANSN